MFEEDTQTLRNGYEAFNRRNLEKVIELLGPEIEWRIPTGGPETSVFRGREGTERLFKAIDEMWASYRADPEEFTDLGDGRVLVFVRATGYREGVVAETESAIAHLWDLRDPSGARVQIYWDRNEALAAAAQQSPRAADVLTVFDESPYVGVVEMPDRIVPSGTSPVMTADGTAIAQLRRHVSLRQRFEVLDMTGAGELCRGRCEGFRLRRYAVRTAAGAELATLQLALFAPLPNKMRAVLPNGRSYEVLGLVPTTIYDGDREILILDRPEKHRTFHLYDLRMEVRAPVFTLLQAVSLAQCIRAVARRTSRGRDSA
jgi:ketosteroid isomerase-like protein